MTGFFKLFADISVYYALIFYLSKAIANVDYFAAGWFFLILMCAARGLTVQFAKDNHPALKLLYLIPSVSLLFSPTFVQAALWIPLWVWCVYSFESGAYDFTYGAYRSLCYKECIVIFLCWISLFFLPEWPYAITQAAFYLAFALAGMVIMLRYLRQEKTGGGISLGLMAALLAASGFCSFFHVFSSLFNLLKRGYLWLVSLLFKIVTPETFSFMDESALPDAVELKPEGTPVFSEGNPVISLIAPLKEMSLFEKILIFLVIALIAGVIIWILFRSMKGHRFYQRKEAEETVEKIRPSRKARMSLFAPGDPREAVRWYYARYVHECVKKGLVVKDNVNSKQIEEASAVFLDEQVCRDFRQLYIRVRYSSAPVTRGDVNLARSYWKQIRSVR